jgi:hypothetical protein
MAHSSSSGAASSNDKPSIYLNVSTYCPERNATTALTEVECDCKFDKQYFVGGFFIFLVMMLFACLVLQSQLSRIQSMQYNNRATPSAPVYVPVQAKTSKLSETTERRPLVHRNHYGETVDM